MKNYVAAVVVAVPVCRPARPARAHPSLVVPFMDGNRSFAHGSASFAGGNATFADGNTSFWYGNAAVRTFGRARRHRPYDFVWMDYAQTVDVVWVDYVEKYGGDGWGRCLCTHLFRPVKGTFHYFLKNRLARWMASLNWRGLM